METILIKIRRLSSSVAGVLFINESVKRKHKFVVWDQLISLGTVVII